MRGRREAHHLLSNFVGEVVIDAVAELNSLVLFVLLLPLLAVGEAQAQLNGGRTTRHFRFAVHQLHLNAAVFAEEVELEKVFHGVSVLPASMDAPQDDGFDLNTLHLFKRFRFDSLKINNRQLTAG